jgi:hypothetical protein
MTFLDTVNYVRFLTYQITIVVATTTAIVRFNVLIKYYLSPFRRFCITFFTYLYFQVMFMLITLRAKKSSDIDWNRGCSCPQFVQALIEGIVKGCGNATEVMRAFGAWRVTVGYNWHLFIVILPMVTTLRSDAIKVCIGFQKENHSILNRTAAILLKGRWILSV